MLCRILALALELIFQLAASEIEAEFADLKLIEMFHYLRILLSVRAAAHICEHEYYSAHDAKRNEEIDEQCLSATAFQ